MKKALAGLVIAFAAAGIARNTLDNNVFDSGLEKGSYLQTWFAINALGYELERERYNMALYAGCNDNETVGILMNLGLKDDEIALTRAFLFTARGLNPFYFAECQASPKEKQDMLEFLMEQMNPAYVQPLLDLTLQQLVLDTEDTETVRYLLDRGANPNVPELHTLGWAAINRSGKAGELVRLLLDYKADPQLGLDYFPGDKPEMRFLREFIRREAGLPPETAPLPGIDI